MHWSAAFVGLPWRELGRDYTGVDCWGLAYLVLRDVFGVQAPLYREYQTTADIPALGAVIDDALPAWRHVPAGAEQAGDVVLLRRGRLACHVGIVTTPGQMLHALAGTNACIESYRHSTWRHRVLGFYRYDQ